MLAVVSVLYGCVLQIGTSAADKIKLERFHVAASHHKKIDNITQCTVI